MLGKNVLLKILINSLLGAVLIFIWSRFVNIFEIITILKTTNLIYVGLFFLFLIFSGVLRGARLKFLLKTHQIHFKDMVMLSYLSQFLSFMIPVRAGELTKSVYLTSEYNLPFGKTIIWVFVDRALDFLVILGLIIIFLPFVPTNLPSNFNQIIVLLLIFFLSFFIISVKKQLFFKKSVIFLSYFLIFSNIKKLFVSLSHTIIEGFEVLERHPAELLILMGLTLLALVSDCLAWLSIFWALGIRLDFVKVIVGNSLEAFSFLVPAAPGFVGSAEAAGLAVWGGILKLDPNQASAAIVLFHIITLVSLLILGLISLYTLKFDLDLVWKKLRGK